MGSKQDFLLNKSLKGSGLSINEASIGFLSAENISFNTDQVASIVDGLELSNITLNNSEINNTPIGQNGPVDGYFNDLRLYRSLTLSGIGARSQIVWHATSGNLDINGGDINVSGCGHFGNLGLCDNTLRSTDANGDINITPNGLGTLRLNSGVQTLTTTGSWTVSAVDVTHVAKTTVSSLSGTDTNIKTEHGDIVLATDLDDRLYSAINSGTSIVTSSNGNWAVGDVIRYVPSGKVTRIVEVSNSGTQLILSVDSPFLSNGPLQIQRVASHHIEFKTRETIFTSGLVFSPEHLYFSSENTNLSISQRVATTFLHVQGVSFIGQANLSDGQTSGQNLSLQYIEGGTDCSCQILIQHALFPGMTSSGSLILAFAYPSQSVTLSWTGVSWSILSGACDLLPG